MIPADPVGLLEAAYAPHPTASAWLHALAPQVVAPFDTEGYGSGAYFWNGVEATCFAYRSRAGSPIDEEVAGRIMAAGFGAASPARMAEFRSVMAVQHGAGSLAEIIGELPEAAKAAAPIPLGDSPGVAAQTADGRVAVFTGFSSRRLELDGRSRAVWRRLAAHLGAACRLAGRPPGPDAPDVEAVLSPGGQLEHGVGGARGPEARAALRDAAVRIDRARRREARADPERALALWQGLLLGRWSLVDHFDSDGRRFLLARRNDPGAPAPRALSRRQGQVAFFASLGWSFKEIAYALGLSESTISAHVGQATRKLGLSSRAELVRVASEVHSPPSREPLATGP